MTTLVAEETAATSSGLESQEELSVRIREFFANQYVVTVVMVAICAVGHLGAYLMWPAAYQNARGAQVASGMMSWMLLGTPMVLWAFYQSFVVAQKTRTFVSCLVLTVVGANALGNIIVDYELVRQWETGGISPTTQDWLNVLVAALSALLIVSWYLWRRARLSRQRVWNRHAAQTTTAMICLLVIATRIEPGITMTFSGSLFLLALSVCMGYSLVALQRTIMTTLQHNQFWVKHRRQPDHETLEPLRRTNWVLRLDKANLFVAVAIFFCWALAT